MGHSLLYLIVDEILEHEGPPANRQDLSHHPRWRQGRRAVLGFVALDKYLLTAIIFSLGGDRAAGSEEGWPKEDPPWCAVPRRGELSVVGTVSHNIA